jgi:hypothetical protein
VTLVEAGADVNARDSFLETPLHAAAKYSLPCTRYLLTLPQVDLSATDENGYTAEYAVRNFGKSAAADAVRAVVRATSWRCGVMSDLCSLATALQAVKGLSSQRPILCIALSCLRVLLWQLAARSARWSSLRAAWVQAVVAGGAPGPGLTAGPVPGAARSGHAEAPSEWLAEAQGTLVTRGELTSDRPHCARVCARAQCTERPLPGLPSQGPLVPLPRQSVITQACPSPACAPRPWSCSGYPPPSTPLVLLLPLRAIVR